MNQLGQGKPWRQMLDYPIPGRKAKPRSKGLTMVLDKGLGLTATRDILELAAPYMDFIKLGFGTSALYPHSLLVQKIELIRSFGIEVYPGGTTLEIALLQNRLETYLESARQLGFTCVEVSEGTIALSQTLRVLAIKKAIDAGFRVLSEVGRKDPRSQIPVEQMLEQAIADLSNGVDRVIIEGRESGKGVTIYDAQGHIKEEDFNQLAQGISDPDRLIWEAPLKDQQQALITQLGPNVNLGNIPTHEILALEALRVGLRADTLKTVLPNCGEIHYSSQEAPPFYPADGIGVS